MGILAFDSSIKGACNALNVDGEVGAIENEQNTSNGLVVVNNDGESLMFPTYFAIGTAIILLIMMCPCLVKRIYRAWNTRKEESSLAETAKSFPIPQTVHFPRSDSSTDKEFLRSSTLGNLLRQARILELAEDKEWGMIYPYPPPIHRAPSPPSLCGQEGTYCHRTPGPPSICGEENYSFQSAPASTPVKEEETYCKIDK